MFKTVHGSYDVNFLERTKHFTVLCLAKIRIYSYSHQSIPTNPLKSGRSSCFVASLNLVQGLTDSHLPSCSKMPMSTSSPKCQCQPPRQTTNVNPLSKMHYQPRAPHSFSVSLPPCRPHSKIVQPLEYFVRCTS